MNNILDLFKRNSVVQDILGKIQKEEFSYYIAECNEHLQYLSTYAAYLESSSFVVYIAPNVYKANTAYEYLSLIAGHENVNLYLTDEIISAELVAVSKEFKEERLNTIKNIINNKKTIIVTHVLGALRLNICKSNFEKNIINLKVNDRIVVNDLLNTLVKMGYQRAATTYYSGDFSVRGEVIDIYSSCSEEPIRINLFDDEIEKIRYFDPESQKGGESIQEFSIYPMNEIIFDDIKDIENQVLKDCKENKEHIIKEFEDFSNYQNLERMNKYIAYIDSNYQSILDYIDDKIIIYNDTNNLKQAYEQINNDLMIYFEDNKISKGVNLQFFFDLNIIFNYSKKIYCSEFLSGDAKTKLDEIFHLKGFEINSYDHNMKLLINELLDNKKETIVLAMDEKEKYLLVKEILSENDILFYEANEIKDIQEKKNNLILIDNAISYGIYNEIKVITEKEIYPKHKKTSTKYRSVYQNTMKIQSKEELAVGDYVVHYDYGIGRYMGIETIELNNFKSDYLCIQYENMPLYVPIDKINLLEKYVGSEDYTPKLNKIGNKDWENKKKDISKKINDIAHDLIDLQIKRESQKGFIYPTDNEFQEMFEDDFEFEETVDQLKIIKEVKKEMEEGKIIDRLICGDVGFGKTEIAMRAAFKTVYSGKQVAYLAPTTILTRQHYLTFKERFEKYGIRVELLNRLVNEAKISQVINELKKGLVDIVIGTHRLLSNDVKFKDLGLLIIDEEQRFGVVHKELIKRMKENVNVLTLTATPIPRTLQMAVMGVRQLSLIETPPVDRHPIQTYVLEQNDSVIKEAIYRELGRGGQVFYLHNRISDIQKTFKHLKSLVPEARICMGHGRMSREELEDTIQAYVDHEYDILLCTTIIETGIDIPNSNTLIIENAEKLGLSQLYQIRGRVGRSDRIAYAYLMYDPNNPLTSTQSKRLSSIKEYTRLGSGYKIAARDLAIRGAGDILGQKQSGYIDSIGLDMYMKMLDSSIKKIKGIEEKEKPTYNIEVSKHIDVNYVSDDAIRIYIHKEISSIDSEEDKEKAIETFTDRFGKLSDDVLLYIEEKYLESLLRKFDIANIMETSLLVTMIIPETALKAISIEDIFMEAYQISPDINFEYKNRELILRIKKKTNDKNWIYLSSKLFTNLEKKRYKQK